MLPYLRDQFGNPSSAHSYGQQARKAVDRAHDQVAALLGCQPDEIVFTSGGSESNNTIIKGVAFALRQKHYHIITTQIEHSAIINPCKFIERLVDGPSSDHMHSARRKRRKGMQMCSRFAVGAWTGAAAEPLPRRLTAPENAWRRSGPASSVPRMSPSVTPRNAARTRR